MVLVESPDRTAWEALSLEIEHPGWSKVELPRGTTAQPIAGSDIAALMIKILNREGNLGIIYDGLPVSGVSGTLGPGYDRFTGSSSAARGAINAKTGWINNAYTLAGIIHSKDGTPLSFAVYALGNVSDNAKAAIDNLVAGMYECGDNLSNN